MTYNLQVHVAQAEQKYRSKNDQECSGCPAAEQASLLHIVLQRLTRRSGNVPSEIHEKYFMLKPAGA